MGEKDLCGCVVDTGSVSAVSNGGAAAGGTPPSPDVTRLPSPLFIRLWCGTLESSHQKCNTVVQL
jgi:hypothetical protein